MRTVTRFLKAEVMWTAGLLAVALPASLAAGEPFSTIVLLEWLGRAIALALFPAGVTVADDVLAVPAPWRVLGRVVLLSAVVAVLVFVLTGIVLPALVEGGHTLPRLYRDMTAGDGWEMRNDAAWKFYGAFAAALRALLWAGIGLQLGLWARYVVAAPLRRPLYWAVFLGLTIAGFGISDTTYEVIVLRTGGNADFATAYPLLLPLGVCAGLALPTLALLRGTWRRPVPD